MSNSNLPPQQYNTPGHVRRASYSKTSSASCANAKPNEDWTQITDLAERRRVQNRIAQRNYREKLKKRLQRAGELEKRAVSTSPTSNNAMLVRPQSSPGPIASRSLSTGPPVNANLQPQQHAPLYQELFPEQYISEHDNQFAAVSEGYMKQPMTSASTPYSFSGFTQTIPASYSGFPPTSSYAQLPNGQMPYSDSGRPSRYTIGSSPMMTPSGVPVTPITPTSNGDCYPPSDGSAYDMEFTQPYNNYQAPATQPYNESTASVNMSDFFRQTYSSS